MPRPQSAREESAHMRYKQRLGRSVPGVPMVLMLRMQDMTQIADTVCTNQRSAIHHLRYPLQSFGDLDVIDCRIDRIEGAEDLRTAHSWLERSLLLRIEGLGLRHPA